MENPRFAGAMSPLGTKPWIAYWFGSWDRLAYTPCSTAVIAGLNALMPVGAAAPAFAGGAVSLGVSAGAADPTVAVVGAGATAGNVATAPPAARASASLRRLSSAWIRAS